MLKNVSDYFIQHNTLEKGKITQRKEGLTMFIFKKKSLFYKYLFIFFISFFIASSAFGFGGVFGSGGGGHGRVSTRYKAGVDSLGAHMGGEGQADITFSCDDPNSTPNLQGVCACNEGYIEVDQVCVKNLCLDFVATRCTPACNPVTGERAHNPACDNEENPQNPDDTPTEDPCNSVNYDVCEKCTSVNGKPVISDKTDGTLCPDLEHNNNYICHSGVCTDPCELTEYDTACNTCSAVGGLAQIDFVESTCGNNGNNTCNVGVCTNPCELAEYDKSCNTCTAVNGTAKITPIESTCGTSGNNICQSGVCKDPCTIVKYEKACNTCTAVGGIAQITPIESTCGNGVCNAGVCTNPCELENYDTACNTCTVVNGKAQITPIESTCGEGNSNICHAGVCTDPCELETYDTTCNTCSAVNGVAQITPIESTCGAGGNNICQAGLCTDPCEIAEYERSCNTCTAANGIAQIEPIESTCGNGVCDAGVCTDPCGSGNYDTACNTCTIVNKAAQIVPTESTCGEGNNNICHSGVCTNPCELETYDTTCNTCTASNGIAQIEPVESTCGTGGNNICQAGTCVNPCESASYGTCEQCTPVNGSPVISNKADNTLCFDSGNNNNYVCRSGVCTNPCELETYDTTCNTCTAVNGEAQITPIESTCGIGGNNICQAGTCTDPCELETYDTTCNTCTASNGVAQIEPIEGSCSNGICDAGVCTDPCANSNSPECNVRRCDLTAPNSCEENEYCKPTQCGAVKGFCTPIGNFTPGVFDGKYSLLSDEVMDLCSTSSWCRAQGMAPINISDLKCYSPNVSGVIHKQSDITTYCCNSSKDCTNWDFYWNEKNILDNDTVTEMYSSKITELRQAFGSASIWAGRISARFNSPPYIVFLDTAQVTNTSIDFTLPYHALCVGEACTEETCGALCSETEVYNSTTGGCDCPSNFHIVNGVCTDPCTEEQYDATCNTCTAVDGVAQIEPIESTCGDDGNNICQAGICVNPCGLENYDKACNTCTAVNGAAQIENIEGTCGDGICNAGVCTNPCELETYDTTCNTCTAVNGEAQITPIESTCGAGGNNICQAGTCIDPCTLEEYDKECNTCISNNGVAEISPVDGLCNHNNHVCQAGICTDPCDGKVPPNNCIGYEAQDGICAIQVYPERSCDDNDVHKICGDKGDCSACTDGYKYWNGQCMPPCENENETYDINGNCTTCPVNSVGALVPSSISSEDECLDCGGFWNSKTNKCQAPCTLGSEGEPRFRWLSTSSNCRSCNDDILTLTTAQECRKCDDADNPRTVIYKEEGGIISTYCGITRCSEGKFHVTEGGNKGQCVTCAATNGAQSTPEECALCNTTENKRYFKGIRCYKCPTTLSDTKNNAESCAQCFGDENNNYYYDGTSCQLCPDSIENATNDASCEGCFHGRIIDSVCQINSTNKDSNTGSTSSCSNGNMYLSYMNDPCGTDITLNQVHCENDNDCRGQWTGAECCDLTTNTCRAGIAEGGLWGFMDSFICPDSTKKSCMNNSQCDPGEFCNLISASDNCEVPDTGTCMDIGDYTDVNIEDFGSARLANHFLTWWGADNWCKANNMTLVDIEDFGCYESGTNNLVVENSGGDEGKACCAPNSTCSSNVESWPNQAGYSPRLKAIHTAIGDTWAFWTKSKYQADNNCRVFWVRVWDADAVRNNRSSFDGRVLCKPIPSS